MKASQVFNRSSLGQGAGRHHLCVAETEGRQRGRNHGGKGRAPGALREAVVPGDQGRLEPASRVMGEGSTPDFLWWVWSWKQDQKLGKLPVTDEALATWRCCHAGRCLAPWMVTRDSGQGWLTAAASWAGCCPREGRFPGSLPQAVGQSSTFVYGLAVTVCSVSPFFSVANEVMSSQSLRGVQTVPNSVKALKYPEKLFRLRVPLKSSQAEWGYIPF